MTRTHICVLLLSLAVPCSAAPGPQNKQPHTAQKAATAKKDPAFKRTPEASAPADIAPAPPADTATEGIQSRSMPTDRNPPLSGPDPTAWLEWGALAACLALTAAGLAMAVIAARRAEACGRALSAEHGTAAASFQ